MDILKCALHFSMGDFTNLLMSANSTQPCSLPSLMVQITDAPFLEGVTVKSCRDKG